MTPKYARRIQGNGERRQARATLLPAALALFVGLTFGCEDDQAEPSVKTEPTGEPTSSGPVVNPEIAEAVAQVADGPEATAPESAPPENGILGTARADAEAPRNAPAKLVLGRSGSDPKLQLGGPEITDERIGQMTIFARMGPNAAMPSVAFKFELSGQKPDEADPSLVPVRVSVVEAKLAAEQPGEIPVELEKAIGQMKDSRLSYRSRSGMLMGPIEAELGKNADRRTESLIDAAADAMRSVLIAYPSEPVGEGAFWMLTAREQLGLAEVVGYHLVKVEEIEGQRATLSIDTKRYLVEEEFQGLPAVRFLGSASAEMVVMPGQRLPIEGKVQQSLQALVQQQDGQPRPFQFDLRALFSFPPKTEAAAAAESPRAP